MSGWCQPYPSSLCLNIGRRSHSCRERSSRTPNDSSHRPKIERIRRRFEEELAESERELQWARRQRNGSPLSPTDYRVESTDDSDEPLHERIEKYLMQRHDEERRSSQRKVRRVQVENDKFLLQSIQQVVRERDAVCEERLAAQRSYYNRLLEEQARRLRTERALQSFEDLNIAQLKDRLTRVEHSNHQLRQSIENLSTHPPMYKSTVYIPNFVY